MKNILIPQPNRKMKRKRGGQKGNQNARKHGFYSSTLSSQEICEFWNIINRERIAPEIAVLRIKLRSLLQHDPDNRRALCEASKLLSKWYSAKHHLDRANTYLSKVIITHILQTQLTRLPCAPDKSAGMYK
jgi:uncharacterized protein YjcR